MTRADALFEAAARWERRAYAEWVRPLTSRLAGNPMSRRLWCLKHARKCLTLAMRAMREEARQERLARYRADNPVHFVRCSCECHNVHRVVENNVVCLNTIQPRRPKGA